MNSGLFSVGAKTEFELFDSLDSKIGTTYTGEFAEIVSDMEVSIFLVKQGPMPSELSESARISASFHHQLHGLLKFKGAVTRIEKNRSGINFYIRIDDDFEEIQKRKYYRPICFSKAEYRLVKDLYGSQDKLADEIPFKTATTRNISFNGVCILLDKTVDISINDLVDLIVWLKQELSIKMRCRVIRAIEIKANGKKKYELGLSIEEINQEDKQLLTEYITRSVMIGGHF